jgi:DHA1 family bicyclomycin/chloramphenicol resistance-like MFS transporter
MQRTVGSARMPHSAESVAPCLPISPRRGLASSLQAVVGSAANGFVAGALAPLVMHSTLALALASAGLMSIGLLAWQQVTRRVAAPAG